MMWNSFADHFFTDLEHEFEAIYDSNERRDSFILNTLAQERLRKRLKDYRKESEGKLSKHQEECCEALEAGIKARFIAHEWKKNLHFLNPKKGTE